MRSALFIESDPIRFACVYPFDRRHHLTFTHESPEQLLIRPSLRNQTRGFRLGGIEQRVDAKLGIATGTSHGCSTSFAISTFISPTQVSRGP